jgi:hypothetical protein
MVRHLAAELVFVDAVRVGAVDACPISKLPETHPVTIIARAQRVDYGTAFAVWIWHMTRTAIGTISAVLAERVICASRVVRGVRCITTIVADFLVVLVHVVGIPVFPEPEARVQIFHLGGTVRCSR